MKKKNCIQTFISSLYERKKKRLLRMNKMINSSRDLKQDNSMEVPTKLERKNVEDNQYHLQDIRIAPVQKSIKMFRKTKGSYHRR